MLDFQEELETTISSLKELKDTVKQERECLKELGKTIPMVASLQVRLMICLVDKEKYVTGKCFLPLQSKSEESAEKCGRLLYSFCTTLSPVKQLK